MGNFAFLTLKDKEKRLPIAPHGKKCSKKQEQKGHVGGPHDDIHGVQAKDSPGNKRGWRLGLGATNSGAVLAAAGPSDLIHRLGTVLRGIVHGLHPMGWEICSEDCVDEYLN